MTSHMAGTAAQAERLGGGESPGSRGAEALRGMQPHKKVGRQNARTEKTVTPVTQRQLSCIGWVTVGEKDNILAIRKASAEKEGFFPGRGALIRRCAEGPCYLDGNPSAAGTLTDTPPGTNPA
jgi:hypothetical protein